MERFYTHYESPPFDWISSGCKVGSAIRQGFARRLLWQSTLDRSCNLVGVARFFGPHGTCTNEIDFYQINASRIKFEERAGESSQREDIAFAKRLSQNVACVNNDLKKLVSIRRAPHLLCCRALEVQ